MDCYNYSVDLPYTKSKIYYREINTEEQLQLAKANLSFPNDKESLYDYHEYIFNVILNCIKNKEDFKKINIIEYVLFLVKLRIVSIGSTIDFLLKGEDDSKTKTKIQVDLKKYLVNLYNNSNFFESDESILKDKNIEIKLNWPFVNSINVFNKILLSGELEYEKFNDSFCEFVGYIKINDDICPFNNINNEQKMKLIDRIPLSLKNKIQDKLLENVKKLVESNIFEISFFDDYKFNFYNLSFVEHIKMLFSYDIKSLFQEIYYLSNHKLPPSYVMGLSQAERKVYLTIIEEEKKRQEKQTPDIPEEDINSGSNYSDAVKKLAVEFGDQMPK
jgi:hypothetical protein